MRIKTKFILLIIIIIIFIFNCYGKEKYRKYSESKFVMGTHLTITFFCNGQAKADRVMKNCFNLADNLEKKVSSQIEDSYISKLNKQKNLNIYDDFTLNLLIDSVLFAEKTNGAFDPSLYKIISLWDFINGNNTAPAHSRIIAELNSTGYKNIIFNGRNVELKNNVSLDLGGIAKGRIIGLIGDTLLENGINDFIINGGGDIVLSGLYNNNERKWMVAIVNPFNKIDVIGKIELTDCSIVTSGDYERNFTTRAGEFYHHIIDPKTGYPAKNNVHSVTVITDDPAKADAYATAFFVMGKDIGLSYANKFENVEAIIITGTENNYNILTTKNIEKSKQNDGRWLFELKTEF